MEEAGGQGRERNHRLSWAESPRVSWLPLLPGCSDAREEAQGSLGDGHVTRGPGVGGGGHPTLLPKLRGPGSPSAPRARPQAQDWKVGGAVVKPAPRLRPSREGLALPPRVGSRQLSGQGCLPPLSQQRPVYCWDWQLPRGLTLDPSQCGQGSPEFPSRALLGSSGWLVLGPAAVDPGAWGTRGGGARVFPMKGASGSSGIHQPFLTPTRPPPQKWTPCSKARGNVPGRSRWGRGLAPGGARAPVSGAGRALCPWQRP